jgi:phosphopentomutase
MIVAGDPVKSPASLGIRETFGDLGVTVAEYLDISTSEMAGTSVLGDLRREDR